MIATATAQDPDESGTYEITPDENGKMICPICTGPLIEPGAGATLHCRVCATVFDAVNTSEMASEGLPSSVCSPRSNHQKTPE